MSSDYRWVCASIDGLGLVLAQINQAEGWSPDGEGSTEFRRITLLKIVGSEGQFSLEKLMVGVAFQGTKISVRPWAIQWLAAPMPVVVAQANKLWSDVQVAKPEEVPEFGGPRRRRR